MAENTKAKNHTALIWLFNDSEVIIPFSDSELQTLIACLSKHIEALSISGDYPEIKGHQELLSNLISGRWLLSQAK